MMKNRRIENPVRFFYPTSDNWSPNFPRNTVEVVVYLYYNTIVGVMPDGLVRIVVRGADDTKMSKEMRVPMAEYPTKMAEFETWRRNLPNPLTKDWLRKDGFEFE